MLTEMQATAAWVGHQPNQREQDPPYRGQEIQERKWPQLEMVGAASEHIAISRWTDPNADVRQEEVLTPFDGYLVSIALKTARLKLSKGNQTMALIDLKLPISTNKEISLALSEDFRKPGMKFGDPFIHHSLPLE